jgi:hypothetical protein
MLPAVNSSLILIIFITIKIQLNVVLLYNFKINFYDKHFEITQVKHTTELISFKTQCNDSTFIDKVFECLNHGGLKNMLQNVISKLLQ